MKKVIKNLRIIKSFFGLVEGQILTLDESNDRYVVSTHYDHAVNSDEDESVKSSYTAMLSIGINYANALIEKGYLEEVVDKSPNFINIFDQIDILIEKYQKELEELGDTAEDAPKCLVVEKEAVLTNLLTLLNYLKGLKK